MANRVGAGGRPRRIVPARLQRVLESAAAGNYMDVCARMAGVDRTTLYAWLRTGREAIENADTDEPEVKIAEWLDQFPDDFKADNLMWVVDPPEGFDPDRWIFALFANRMEKAKVVAEAAALQSIRMAERAGNWQAAAWYLERTRPEKYGRRIIEHQGSSDPGAAPIRVETVSTEALLTRIAELQGEIEA